MLNIVIVSNFAKIFFICIFSYFANVKIINYRNHNFCKIVVIIIVSILVALLYIFLIQYLLVVGAFIISYIIYGIIINNILKTDFRNAFVSTTIAVIIAYIMYLISTLLSGLLLVIFVPNIDYKNPISLLSIPIIEALLLWGIFKMKRFKYGLNFLKHINTNKSLLRVVMIFSAVIMLIFGLLQRNNNLTLNTCLSIGTIFIAIGLISFLQDQITKHYREKMKDRTIEIQKQEINEQLQIIQDIKEENFRLAKVIHKYNHRLSALELGIKNTIKRNTETEFADELFYILKETEDISKNFSNEVIVKNKKLPSTNVIGIDNMFKYMQEEANKSNINFDLKINESINYLLEKIIYKEKFETLIGDHLKDSIVAVNESDNSSYKSILVILGVVEDCYEFSVYDTGIEFEIETLLKLGLEKVTTHKEIGGNGIRFYDHI